MAGRPDEVERNRVLEIDELFQEPFSAPPPLPAAYKSFPSAKHANKGVSNCDSSCSQDKTALLQLNLDLKLKKMTLTLLLTVIFS